MDVTNDEELRGEETNAQDFANYDPGPLPAAPSVQERMIAFKAHWNEKMDITTAKIDKAISDYHRHIRHNPLAAMGFWLGIGRVDKAGEEWNTRIAAGTLLPEYQMLEHILGSGKPDALEDFVNEAREVPVRAYYRKIEGMSQSGAPPRDAKGRFMKL
jgi:hypothetical protein